MADIELVIRIPEDEYRNILLTGKASFCVVNAIEAGTPLPKGHGRIIDGDIVLTWLIYKGVIDKLKCGEVASVFEKATIIEADGGDAG